MAVPEPLRYVRTTYFEFVLPENWQNDRHGKEIVCMPPKEEEENAIIIMAVKSRNHQDNLDDYLSHLQQVKVSNFPGTGVVSSQVVHARKVRIGAYEWIDALHYESEVPGYYTRYLATHTTHIGLVVTFSVAKEWNERYTPAFEKSIESLVIYQTPLPL